MSYDEKKEQFVQVEEKLTFTKTILAVVVLLYFVGAVLGGVLVIVSAMVDIKLGGNIDVSMFIAYGSYIGAPTATAIGFYAWKSKAENVLKIQKSAGIPLSHEFIQLLADLKGDNQ